MTEVWAGRRWLVTGTSSGFGRAIIANGGTVFAGARDPESIADLVSQGAGRVHALKLDVTCGDDIAAAPPRSRSLGE